MIMDEESLKKFEEVILDALSSKLTGFDSSSDAKAFIEKTIKSINPTVTKEEIEKLVEDINNFRPIEKYLDDEDIEDIMINNTSNIFVYRAGEGQQLVPERFSNKKDLDKLVNKFEMYATTATAHKNVYDVHMPNGSRVNIVNSPLGADITIRNFKKHALSIIDLINSGMLSYGLAARLWLYSEGLKIRPANMLVGGLPASGKTTLLNAMFSFFRPEERIVVIEETYELNTETQENCVRLETNPDVTMQELVQNALRMRPDMLIIGEVRGAEAKDMMTAMNIGKIAMSTIHASTSRDVITRLEHTPMDIDRNIITLVDVIIMAAQVNENNKLVRRITQVSEIAGVETQVLLSDLFRYDYKTHKSTKMLPSVTYRDALAGVSSIEPNEILAEETKRRRILEQLNKIGVRDLRGINEFCKEYYDNPDRAVKKIDLPPVSVTQES